MAKEIYKWSIGYALLRFHVKLTFRLFYRSIDIKGLENIPKGVPVILAPNHQNALMDALAAMQGLKGVQVFIARADIFQNKFIARILNFIKILPAYRMRDGYGNLGKNEEVFEKAIEVLQNGRIFCIMPEGTHSEFRQLKPLVKGIFRLIFKYIEENPDKTRPVIIPVGLDYSNYQSCRSQIIINYGKPIDSNAFYELYQINPAEGINRFRDQLSLELKPIMLNIEDKQEYENINFLRELLRPLVFEKLQLNKKSSYNRFMADKWFTEQCNQLVLANSMHFEKITKSIKKLMEVAKNYRMEPSHIIPALNYSILPYIILPCILFFPVFLIGLLFHILPLRAPRLLTNKINDRQFHSSVKFVLLGFLIPLWYLFWGILVYIFFNSLLLSLIAIAAFALIGEFSYRYYSIWEQCYAYFKIKRNRKNFEEIKNATNTIIDDFKTNRIL